MPACGPDWQLVSGIRMRSDSISIIVRTILQEGGGAIEGTQNFTSHSMKTTFLPWCGKAGIPKPYRPTLGAHSHGKDCMSTLHSRDELSEPFRQLGPVLAWIMQRTSIPNSTRSGRWQTQPEQGEPSHRHSSAGAVLEARTKGNDTLP